LPYLDPNSRVYFILAGKRGPIKIGFSKSFDFRLKKFQAGHYKKLTVLAWIPGGEEKETELHHRFKAHHIRGDWFKPAKEIMEFLLSIDGASKCQQQH
jgi:hypothetical protein